MKKRAYQSLPQVDIDALAETDRQLRLLLMLSREIVRGIEVGKRRIRPSMVRTQINIANRARESLLSLGIPTEG